MRRKYFTLGFLAATWVLDPSIIDLAQVRPVLYWPTDMELSGPFHGDPST